MFQTDNLIFKDRKLNVGPAIRKQVILILSPFQGFHTSWKVLDFFSKIPGPGNMGSEQVLKNFSWGPGKVLDFCQ